MKPRKSSMDINFPDTLPPTPYGGDYIPHPPYSPRKTSFLFPESLLPLRNRLPNIAPLPSWPSIDNFARPLTRIIDDKSNTIEITPKKPDPNINETNQNSYRKFFQMLMKLLKKILMTLKKKLMI